MENLLKIKKGIATVLVPGGARESLNGEKDQIRLVFFANKYLYFKKKKNYQAGVFANNFFLLFYQAGAEEQEGLHQARDQTRRSSRSYFLLRRAEGL